MVEIKNCTCIYQADPDHKALDDLSLSIKEGEFVLLTGASGCGKTTVLRLLNGLIPHFYDADVEGKILIDGKPKNELTIYDLSGKTGTVFQNPRAQFYTCDVRSELAFGCENQGMEESKILARLEETAKKFSLEELLDRSMFDLSGGQKQQIACASIDMENTSMILLDEPSANLDHEAVRRLKEILTIWKKEGKTVVVSEHRIAYLWDICDRMVILADGKVKKNFTGEEMSGLSEEEVRSLGIRSFTDRSPFDCTLPEILPQDECMEFAGYRFSYKKSDSVFAADSIKMAKGEITALVGQNGAGKTTFLNCLCGLRKCKGVLKSGSTEYSAKQRKDMMFMIMQDVSHQLFAESVLDEVRIGMPEEKEEKAIEILKALDLEQVKDRHPQSLSGGQMQRLAIAFF